MLSSLARSSTRLQHPKLLARAIGSATIRRIPAAIHPAKCFSTTPPPTTPADPQIFKPNPPAEITADMAESIQDSTLFYLKHGVAKQRLLALASQEAAVTIKWPRMMEIFLSTQVFVISGLGFTADEAGLQNYTTMLAKYMAEKCDEETKELYRKVGQEIWRELLCTAYALNPDEIEPIQIVDARNIMHKVCSKMQEPSILMKIQKECAKVETGPDLELEMAQKHQILQAVILNDVYLGGSPTIVEESGFESGDKGYAHLQCVMAEFEGDPLINQYMQGATHRMWEAAGLDLNAISTGESGGKILS